MIDPSIPLLVVFAGLLALLWRQQKTIDLCVWRAFLLKGLNPAIENPEAFGPKAMAEAHTTLQRGITGPAEAPPNFFDEGEMQKRQVAEWEREALEYEAAAAASRAATSDKAVDILTAMAKRTSPGSARTPSDEP